MNEKMITYRPATETQYDEFLALMLDHMADYVESLMALMEMTVVQYTEIFRTVGQVYAIYQGAESAGFYWIEEREREIHLHGLILKEQYRGRGIGHQTLEMLEDQYTNIRDFIELGVHKSNPRAIKLYKKMGYRVVKELEDLGFYVMQKPLREGSEFVL